MKVELCSFKDIEHIINDVSKQSIAYLPVGCIEQHGPILPLATDSLIATAIAEDLCNLKSSQEFNGVVYPPVTYTPSRSNISFKGSVTIDESVFRSYLENICTSILRHRFSAIALICMHGPAEPSLIEIAFRMNQLQIESGEEFRPLIVLGMSQLSAVFRHILGDACGKHADSREFLLLYKALGKDFFDQERMDHLQAFNDTYHSSTVPETTLVGIPMNYRSVDGVIGSPLPGGRSDYDNLSNQLWSDILDVLSAEIDAAVMEAGDICST